MRTPRQNRRYYLHQRCRHAGVNYSPRSREVFIPFSQVENVPAPAMSLGKEYGYNVQLFID